MSKKKIESKILKYLRKASRQKIMSRKLEYLNELLNLIDTLVVQSPMLAESTSGEQAHIWVSENEKAQYIELCQLYKRKFQMDALFAKVERDVTLIRQDANVVNQELFSRLVRRLLAILDLDADHPDAQGILDFLLTQYPQYDRAIVEIDVASPLLTYQMSPLCIEISSARKDIDAQKELQTLSQSYRVSDGDPVSDLPAEPTDELCRLRFYEQQLPDFERFHDELRKKRSYRITVNRQAIDEKYFSEWLQCYTCFLKADNPQYCYGASPLTLNVFGCHKLNLPDVARELEACWFSKGTFDDDAKLFLIAGEQIANHVREHLPYCGFCPALAQEKLALGMALLPRYINPECDPNWAYLSGHGETVRVIPTGNDLAIAALASDFQTMNLPEFIEVGSTPSMIKMLQYLQSYNLSETYDMTYRGISRCMICGTPYKLHTMTCPKCRLDFAKHALKDLEKTFARLLYPKPIELQRANFEPPQKEPQRASPSSSSGGVSFAQLWDDPDVQQLLMSETDAHEQPPQPAPVPVSAPQAGFSERFDFHQKLRGLLSKRYRERKAIESSFSQVPETPAGSSQTISPEHASSDGSTNSSPTSGSTNSSPTSGSTNSSPTSPPSPQPADAQPVANIKTERQELVDAIKKLKQRQKSELSKRGVVRITYHATMDKDICPLCAYLDGMVMDPDDPATDIFCPPLYPGCTCRREYVLKTEKPKNWPRVTFQFPPEQLLVYLDKRPK